MARTKLLSPLLEDDQEAEAKRIFERIRGTFEDEAWRLARLMASKPTRELFGQTEFQIRDRVHQLGAEVLQAAAQERAKPVKKGASTAS